jgi:hypothetical protein
MGVREALENVNCPELVETTARADCDTNGTAVHVRSSFSDLL